MDIGVEISLYPLKADFVPVIHEFLERVNRAGQLRVVTNSMSTQIFGPFDAVMQLLREELRTTFETLAGANDKAVFVLKVLGPLPPA
ncbi:MAG TPA: YkoF family thiamine/hydroxymethylpyrimidine-binding protein [Steroidobacteraceae bacterium]